MARRAAGLRRAGRSGPVEQPHLRPWSTVLRAPTGNGTVWLKATGPANAFEAGLYELLVRLVPESVLCPIAVDTDRGWILLPDGGPSLGDRLTGVELAEALGSALARYGRLQRQLAVHADALSDLGVADIAASCERLAALPGAPSLDHNDLHPWNVLVDSSGGVEGARFYDWGDAVVAHPFASMLVPLGFVQHALQADLRDPRFLRIRDAYLDAFADLGSRAELVEALELACHLGKVARALTWDRALREGGYGDDEFGDGPIESLRGLMDDTYLGRA